MSFPHRVSYLEEQFLPLNHKLPYEPTQKGALNFKFVPSKDLPKTLLILLPGFKYQAYVDDECEFVKIFSFAEVK